MRSVIFLPRLLLLGLVLGRAAGADLGDGLPEAGAVADSSAVYSSPDHVVLRLPQIVWRRLVHPLGRFTIYAERTELPRRVEELFTSDAGTFGLFPQLQLGGETDSGGGARFFHNDLFGGGQRLEAFYVFSAADRQRAEVFYRDDDVGGGPWFFELRGSYLDSDSDDATINGVVEGRGDLLPREERLFALRRTDVTARYGWRSNAGPLEEYTAGWSLVLQGGWSQRDLTTRREALPDLRGETSTGAASAVHGLGRDLRYLWAGLQAAWDDRDAKPARRELTHPLIYHFPGRVLVEEAGLYHSFRDLAYPERGTLAQVNLDVARGGKEVAFARLGAQVQRFHTLFWRDRILAGRLRLDKLFPLGDRIVPYADLPTLGGTQRLRGYQRGTFRGEGALLLALEYRWPVWDTWSGALFWEEGQVFDDFGDIDAGRFASTVGAALRLRTERAFLLGLRVAHSAEEMALLGFSLEQEF